MPRIAIVMLGSFFCWATLASGTAVAQCYSTPWFSEEREASAFCQPGYAVRGIICSGGYCDNKRLTCCAYTNGYDPSARYWWSQWFSEEAPSQVISGIGFVSGVGCRGGWCDNLRLNFFSSNLIRNNGQCHFSRMFSEEPPASANCGGGEFVSGVRCTGPYCDNLELWCCGRR